jgi:hypothetical protein
VFITVATDGALNMSRIYVCQECIEDSELQKVIAENAISLKCDYCGQEAESPIACELSDVVERISYAVSQEYSSPDEETMYDPEEGDYFGNVLEHTEMFDEIGFWLENMELYDDIIEQFWDERFCRKGMLSGSMSERQMDAWHGFKKVVKNQRRFTFWSMDDADYGVFEHPPSVMVRNIARTTSKFELIRRLDMGTRFWRVRVHDKAKSYTKAEELAAPNCDQAIHSNRMSPAGVSMFYGADELDTAILETVDPDDVAGKHITGCYFSNVRQFVILDLLELPTYKFFSELREHDREGIAFLEAFQKDISEPIKKDGKQHIEYVPTQVFTEYVRYELKTSDDEQIDGIRFRSSKDGKGCYVLFCDQDGCLPDIELRRRDQQLEFDESSLLRVDAEEWSKQQDV